VNQLKIIVPAQGQKNDHGYDPLSSAAKNFIRGVSRRMYSGFNVRCETLKIMYILTAGTSKPRRKVSLHGGLAQYQSFRSEFWVSCTYVLRKVKQ